MKTLNEVKRDIEFIIENLNGISQEVQKRLYKKNIDRLKFLRLVELYLITNPNEDFLKSQLSYLENRLTVINDGLNGIITKEDVIIYKKIWDVKGINDKINCLKYILN